MNVIVPLNKRVVVDPEEKEKQSAGGIIIPETANQKTPTKGRIIAIAQDSDINMKIQPGDIVLFSKYAGVEITLVSNSPESRDKQYLLIKDEDLLAVIERR